MSGVAAAMRRTLLSCTSLARNGLIALAAASEPALAGDLFRHCRTASPGRSAARAAVRRTPGPDFMGRGRQPAPDQRRHLAVDLARRPAKLAPAHPRLWNLAAAGTGAADGSCRRCAARGRRGVSAQPLDLERPRDRGHGPRHRRPGHCQDSRTRGLAPGTRRIESALQDAAGGDRAAARLRRRGTLADLGQERPGRPALCQYGLCAGHRGHQRRGCHPPQSRTARDRPAHRDEPGSERQYQLFRPVPDRGRRRAAHL